MKNAIILHGKPGRHEYFDATSPASSNNYWLPWLQKQLIVRGIAAHTPEIPEAWRPVYATWAHEFEGYDITRDTMLVGHSCGGGFIVRWLGEHPYVHVGSVVLVAPSLGVGWDDTGFFDFKIDPRIAQKTRQLTIFSSDNDSPNLMQAAEHLRDTIIGAMFQMFPGYGHFLRPSGSSQGFPELLDALVKNKSD